MQQAGLLLFGCFRNRDSFSHSPSWKFVPLCQRLKKSVPLTVEICLTVCSALSAGASAMLDATAGGWQFGRTRAAAVGLPYVHLQASVVQHMSALDGLLVNRNATDAALVFAVEWGENSWGDQWMLVPVRWSFSIVISSVMKKWKLNVSFTNVFPNHIEPNFCCIKKHTCSIKT